MKDEKNNQIYTGVKIQSDQIRGEMQNQMKEMIQRQPWPFLDKGGSWQIEEEMQSGDVQLSNMRGSTIKMRSANAKYEVGFPHKTSRVLGQS